jgi:hypothetical protein
MKCNRMLVIGIAAVAVAAPSPAAKKATPQSPLLKAIADCRAQRDDAARLRCYDSAAGALAEAAEKGNVVVVSQEDVRKTRRSLFGFTLPKLPFFEGDKSAAGQEEQITATIASARSLGYDRWQIRLEDGAIWETTESASTIAEPRAGQTVVIRRGALGNYFIRIAGQSGVRGRRVG